MRWFLPSWTAALAMALAGNCAQGDNIYVSYSEAGKIVKYDAGGNGSVFAEGLDQVGDIVFGHDGCLYAAMTHSGVICRIDPAGHLTALGRVSNAWGLAFDGGGNLFVADNYYNWIYKFDPNGNRSVFAVGLNTPMGLAFGSDGYLYEADRASGSILKFDTNGNRSVFASGLGMPTGLAFDENGDLYVSNGDLFGTVLRLDPSGNAHDFISGLKRPFGLAFDSTGYLYVANEGVDEVDRFDANGNKSPFSTGFLGGPSGIAVQVPEPASLMLVGSGVLGLTGVLLRRLFS